MNKKRNVSFFKRKVRKVVRCDLELGTFRLNSCIKIDKQIFHAERI